MNTQAKFFCENCNSEVRADARFCPTCGKFFSSVKCPMCGAVGTSQQFKDGCPKCGYAEGKSSQANSETKSTKKFAISNSKTSKKKSENANGSTLFPKRFVSKGDDALPAWIYIAAAVLLIGIIAFFIFRFV